MPLLRSGSAKSTLSMMHRRTTRYQKFLNVSNVLLLIVSTIIIFTSVLLMKFYHINKLDFWSSYFYLVPVIMLVLGIYTFVVCVVGFLISGSESRIPIAIYAVMLTMSFVVQLVSIFMSLELRTIVAQEQIRPAAVTEELTKYGSDLATTDKWDELQSDMNCCGARTFGSGYIDYRNTKIGLDKSVPDSCCLSPSEGCGKNIFDMNEEQIRKKIFVHGCLTILQKKMDADVIPMMIVYACVGVLLAITELITIVLSWAYIGQISRKRRREANMFKHVADANEDPDYDATDNLNHETMC